MKLTMAQAVIRYLNNQYIQRDEKENKFIAVNSSIAIIPAGRAGRDTKHQRNRRSSSIKIFI